MQINEDEIAAIETIMDQLWFTTDARFHKAVVARNIPPKLWERMGALITLRKLLERELPEQLVVDGPSSVEQYEDLIKEANRGI